MLERLRNLPDHPMASGAVARRRPQPEEGSRSPADAVQAPGPGRGQAQSRNPEPAADAEFVNLLNAVQDQVLSERPDLIRRGASNDDQRRSLTAYVEGVLARRRLGGSRCARDHAAERITAELTGLGPLEPLLNDRDVTEIMVNGPSRVYVEKYGAIHPTAVRFRNRDHVIQLVQRIIAPLGRRLDTSQPFVDARLPDGSRVHAMIDPVAVDGPLVTVRRFTVDRLDGEQMVAGGSMNGEILEFLRTCVVKRLAVLVSGGTSSGKTTLLNALSRYIPEGKERIITIEEAAELNLKQDHVLRLEARPANVEGLGEVSVRTLVRNALRMRPDRIVIGEVRGPEAFDLLQALNTGHRGSMCTIHANSCADALIRLENMVLMAPERLPHQVVERQVTSAVDVVVHQERLPSGLRLVQEVMAVTEREGRRRLVPLFAYRNGFVRLWDESDAVLDPLKETEALQT